MLKVPSNFVVNKTRLQAYFHKPENPTDTQLPIVVMANGYATEWQFGTNQFIRAFADAGIATLNFDYRSFGESEGIPRQVVNIPGQQEDFLAAVEHAKKQPWVDTSRIVIWGSSLGGGHAISTAAKLPEVCAMVAQVPHCCSRAAFKTVTLGSVFSNISKAIADSMKSLFSSHPILVPILAEPGQAGVMTHANWLREYQVLAGDSPTWQNAMPARSLLKGGDYRPLMVADQIQCPSLIVAAENDAGVPLDSVKETVNKIQQGELKIIKGDHFGVYQGDPIEDVIASELAFIKKHVFK
ncbi:MAG: alpha/beta fold hydrolase [Cellvibrionales bacterium]|nr:alpha/beta fold hydrolase [Cellvibrionales bacterium]